jgi:hypothetical protein
MATDKAAFNWLGAAFFASLSPSWADAQERTPLSAIDWLSDSIDLPADETQLGTDETPAQLPNDVTVMSLDAPVPDSVGLRPANELGLNPGLWGRSSAADLARTLADMPDGVEAPPTVMTFLRDVLTAGFEPPVDAAIDDSFFLARIDRLLAMGHLMPAADLLKSAGPTEAKRFRRVFDIALLTGTETEACGIVESTPDLSPTYPTRIFCLARLGEWDVAALTLGNAEALGILSDDEDDLLKIFLDPELFEGDPLPDPPRTPTPLLFRLYEAVGERIQTDQLPVAFALADLEGTQGWKARLRAGERLVAAGVMSFEDMIAVFSERKPAASGGVWERVAALQAVVPALDSGSGDKIGSTLSAAWIAAGQGGYPQPFAEWAVPFLTGIELNGPARHLAFEMALLAGKSEIAAEFVGDSDEDRFLLALSTGQGGAPAGAGSLYQAISRGMVTINAGSTYETLIEDDRSGEAMFRALGHLKRDAGGNPQATQNALALLRKLGLSDLARQIAVELILMDGAA